jgi:hypothetical protein
VPDNRMMINVQWIWKVHGTKRPWPNLRYREGLRKPQKNLIRKAGLRAKIWTRDLLNTKKGFLTTRLRCSIFRGGRIIIKLI